jgi:regulator of replication initiation timing
VRPFLDMTDVGQIGTALRALAADLVTERERVRSLSRENRALLRENSELLERLESVRLESDRLQSTACPHCGLPMYGAEVGQLDQRRRARSATGASAASQPA